MLKQVLVELEQTREPLSIQVLGERMGVSPSAVSGMVDFWVRKGRLKVEGAASADAACRGEQSCSTGRTCPGPAGCPFIVQLPRMISLVEIE